MMFESSDVNDTFSPNSSAGAILNSSDFEINLADNSINNLVNSENKNFQLNLENLALPQSIKSLIKHETNADGSQSLALGSDKVTFHKDGQKELSITSPENNFKFITNNSDKLLFYSMTEKKSNSSLELSFFSNGNIQRETYIIDNSRTSITREQNSAFNSFEYNHNSEEIKLSFNQGKLTSAKLTDKNNRGFNFELRDDKIYSDGKIITTNQEFDLTDVRAKFIVNSNGRLEQISLYSNKSGGERNFLFGHSAQLKEVKIAEDSNTSSVENYDPKGQLNSIVLTENNVKTEESIQENFGRKGHQKILNELERLKKECVILIILQKLLGDQKRAH